MSCLFTCSLFVSFDLSRLYAPHKYFLHMHTVSSIYSIRPIRQSSLHNQSVRFETMCAPCSWYSCRVTHSDLNVASEARMDLTYVWCVGIGGWVRLYL